MRHLGLEPDIHFFNDLIFGCLRVGHSDQAKYFYEAMTSANLKPDIETYAMVLGTCFFENNALRGASVFKELSQKVTPSKEFLQSFSTLLKRAGNTSEASSFDALSKQPNATQEDVQSALDRFYTNFGK